MKTKYRMLLAAVVTIATIGGTAVSASASPVDDPGVVDILTSLSEETADQETSEFTDLLAETAQIDPSDSPVLVNDVPIEVPAALDAPVTIGEGADAIGIHRPGGSSTDASGLQPGVSVHEATDGTAIVTVVKEDSTLQIATILSDERAPERFDYVIDIPTEARLELVNGQPFVWSADGSMIGGFFPAWAKDAAGRDVATRYEVSGNILTQVVEHQALTDVQYPIVADPAYRRGMIGQVKWERWANGGWEIRLTVTALARATQPINPAIVYTEGLADLREHHPRGMEKKTMAQQWDCHVVGLPGTINIDLESYRKSWDGWRAGIVPAVLQGNPAKACNW